MTIGPLESGQSPRAVTLNGTVDPERKPVNSCVFEYGTRRRRLRAERAMLPARTPSLGTGSASVPVSAQLTGLVPETVYHYRLSAENGAGRKRAQLKILCFTRDQSSAASLSAKWRPPAPRLRTRSTPTARIPTITSSMGQPPHTDPMRRCLLRAWTSAMARAPKA